MNLIFKDKGDKLIVHMEGELDHHSAEEVRNKIDDRLERKGCKKLIMDFYKVTFMDSSGIGVVIGRYKKLSLREGKVYITRINDSVRRVFELSGIFKIIPLYESVAEALDNI